MKKHVIIIHEIYGVTQALKELQRLLSRLGCSVSLPSLYADNYVGTDDALSYDRFYSKVGLDTSFQLINNIIEQRKNTKIILLGFSVGATIAWLHSTNKKISQVIGIYGSKIRNYLEVQPTVNTYLLFCNEALFDMKKVMEILNNKEKVTATMIPGEHGFYNKKNAFESLITRTNNEIIKIIESI